jgi:hypothetical protein
MFQGLGARLCAQNGDDIEEGQTSTIWHYFEDEIINDRFMHRIDLTCRIRLDRRHTRFELGASIEFSDGRGCKLVSHISCKLW